MKLAGKMALIAGVSLSAFWVRSTLAQRSLELVGYQAEPGGTPESNLWQVLVLMGLGDREPTAWDGRAAITDGELFDIEGYRFELPDRVHAGGNWSVRTKLERVTYGQTGDGRRPEQLMLPKGVLLRGSGTAATRLRIETAQGSCDVSPMRLEHGRAERCAGGRIEVRRLPAASDLSGTELRQHDFPAIGAHPDGKLWITWSSFHNRQEELNMRGFDGARWTRLIPVARAEADLWRPSIQTDSSGRPWIIWSQQTGGDWNIFAMPWEFNTWGAIVKLSENPLPDIEVHTARAPDGTIYAVWQAMEGAVSHIHLRYLRDNKWSELVRVTSGEANDWDPAIAAGPDGRAWIAWDRYNGDYDVHARDFLPGRGLGEERRVTSSPRMEAFASITVDARNRPWIAWETGGVNWGKDLGPLSPKSIGSALGDARRVELVALDQGVWKSPPEFAPRDALQTGATSICRPMLFADPNGSIWMTFKRRYSRIARNPSAYWETFASRLDGGGWSEPMLLPKSGARNSTRMGMAAAGGRLWFFYPSESRRYDFASRARLNRVIAGSVALRDAAGDAPLAAYQPAPANAPAGHRDEAGDVSAIRNHRVRQGRETLRIVRGDLHRHTEFSPDQGGLSDGSLPEFYRYMIDAAAMDFGASTDHQAGGNDYWAFLTWKMADMYHFPRRFVPLYAYERNLGFPHGHRNIVHTRRNYPIVPFFQRPDPKFQLPDAPDGEILTFNSNAYGGGVENDTKLLYEELRKTGGLAIPHTSGSSGMGTDWRDNDRELEPLVEIYQGDRINYEHKNAPRGARDGEESRAIGGFQEAGLVWNAWKKGYRLGVITSSDHFSTHISYAMVYTPKQDRQSIFDAMKKRQAYGATDNIILEFWMGDHFMGSDFRSRKREKIRVKVRGTAPVAAVHLIRDARYIHKAEPNKQEFESEFVDMEAGPGEHWYYVRVEQSDGELAWSSPIWHTVAR